MLPRNVGAFVTVETTKPNSWVTNVMLHEIVDDETHAKILQAWDGPTIGFGGGIEAIAVSDIVKDCNDNPRTMARKLGITIKLSNEILEKYSEISKREFRS